MIKFKIAETDSFIKQLKLLNNKNLYSKIKKYVCSQLFENPFYGLNIKKLKGDLSDIYRYSIGNFRLFYELDMENNIIVILSIKNRKDSCK
ncbi:MAG: type II toxin-antitoxin system RelE/ParE family toxin [Bacteroidales bacterium]|nr:type II toxin-antitoxin system RelE/ParE family toxin [Bacteroidales bacterium]